MIVTSDRDVEAETVIRWDRTSAPAVLYTADAVEMRRWRNLGYPLEVVGMCDGKPCGWQTCVPAEAVALLPLRGGQVQASRWLEPPTIRPKQAHGTREPGKTDANIEEIHPVFLGSEKTPAGQGVSGVGV